MQVQRWLGHHSASFTLAVYVHLLPDDIPAPLDIGGGNKVATEPTANHPTTPDADLVDAPSLLATPA